MEVANDVGSSFFLLLLEKVVNDAVIETSRPRWVSPAVAKTVVDRGNIESSTTKIVNDDLRLATFLVKAIGNSGSGGFIDGTKVSKVCNCTGILGSLTPRVIEV